MRLITALLLVLLAAACGRGVPDGARIVVAGDSVMAWNRGQDAGIADELSRRLSQPVGDVSLPSAAFVLEQPIAFRSHALACATTDVGI